MSTPICPICKTIYQPSFKFCTRPKCREAPLTLKDVAPVEHEPIKIDIGDIPIFNLELEDAKKLVNFFYDIGYISPEFHSRVRELSREIENFVKRHELAKRDPQAT